METGFIVRKKNELSVNDITGNNCVLIVNDKNEKGDEINDIAQDEKTNVNQITTDLLKNINSASWNAIVKMISDKTKVQNTFTDKFFLVGQKREGNDAHNTAKKVLICITNGIDAYRRIKYTDYVGFADIPRRYISTKTYIFENHDENVKKELLIIANNVFNKVYGKTDINKTFDDIKQIYQKTSEFLNQPSAPPDEDPVKPAGSGLRPASSAAEGGIESIGIRYPLSSILRQVTK